MSIIKLKDAGDSHTALVAEYEEVQGTYGPQVKFTLDNGDVIFVGDEPAKRQLGRCGFPDDEPYEATVPGNILTFAREPNTTKKGAAPYWAITLAGNADLKPKAPSKRLPSPPSAPSRPELPADGPPAFHRDVPLPDSPEGELVAAAAEAVQGFEGKRGALIDGYLALYAYVAARLVVIGREHDFPVDGQSINAATATISIALDKRNLL